MNNRWIREIRKLILFAAVTVACFWRFDMIAAGLKRIIHVIYPFLLGGSIAFLLGVPMNFLERALFTRYEKRSEKNTITRNVIRRAKRPICLFLVIFFLLLSIAGVFFFLIPQIVETMGQIGARAEELAVWMDKLVGKWNLRSEWMQEMFGAWKIKWEDILSILTTFLRERSRFAIQNMIGIVQQIISGTATFLISVVFACYVLLQKERLKIQTKKLLYAFTDKGKADAVCEVCALTYETFAGFLTGQCFEAFLLAMMFLVTMWMFRIPYAALISVVIGFTALVPIFGSLVGFVIGFFLLVMMDASKAITFAVVFLVLQQLEGNFVYPRVVGTSVGLPSIWVFAAVTVGGRLFGVVGILLFIPLASVSYALLREVVRILHRKRHVEYLFYGKREKNARGESDDPSGDKEGGKEEHTDSHVV